jgi:hypothetical protein
MNFSTSATFKVNITNSAPYLESKIGDMIVSLNSKVEYLIPMIIDKEFNPVKIIWQKPNFVYYNSSTNMLIINPKSPLYDLGFF